MPDTGTPEILYVEDDLLTAKRVLTELADTGYLMVHVNSGEEALRKYREKDYDLVAIDLVLPDMDGKEVIRQMKDIKPLPPTVVITGYGDEETVVDVMRLGVRDYIPKDTDGRYIILLPTVFEMAVYHGRMDKLKRAIEQELHQNRENFRNLLNASEDFIYVVDKAGKILSYNPALQRALGYTDQELRSMYATDLHPPVKHEETQETLKQFWEGKAGICTIPMLCKSGALLDIEARVAQGQWGGEDVLYIISRDMTHQHRAERAQRESQQMLELVMDNIPEHIFWKDAELRYLGCNENYARSAGVDQIEDLVGKTDDELGYPVLTEPEWLRREQSVIETGEPELHTIHETHDAEGNAVIFDVNRIPLRDEDGFIIGLLCTCEDITQRIETERRLQERDQFLRVVTTNLRDVLGLVDKNFIWQYASPSHEDVLGRRAASLVGTSPLHYVHEDDIPAVQTAIRKGMETKTAQRLEFRFQHINGHYFWLEAIGVPNIDKDGEIESIVLASRDITERKKAEQDLVQRTQELQESNEEMDAFSHTVAHDLKNPLNSILGLANLLREDVEMSEEEVRDSLKFIEQSATTMNGIIDSLMVLTGVRKQEVELEDIDMGELVERTLGRLTFYIHDMNAEVTAAPMPCSIGYVPWIQEVWVNYITNAIKYGGNPPVVQIGGETLTDGRVKYWVQDNGMGISEEDQQRLFVPFSRLRQVSVKGYGLGLSIVTRIIERLDGEVGVESAVGEGSTFYFILPGCESEKENE